MTTLHELLDLFYKIEATDRAQLKSITPLDETDYEISIYSDWIDGHRFYSKIFVVNAETGATTSGFDDIKWHVEVMYKETLEEQALRNKRQAVLNKLTAEEKELLGL